METWRASLNLTLSGVGWKNEPKPEIFSTKTSGNTCWEKRNKLSLSDMPNFG